jgi:hypothetical protein
VADEKDPRDNVIEGEVLGRDDEAGRDIQIDTRVIAGLTRAEIDVQIATAHKYRRSITSVQRQIETFATLDAETATSCFFRKPQREKKKDPKTGREAWVDGYIEGPSIRFAEIVMQAWGNGRVASRVTDQTATEIEATGVFHDLESNVAWAKSVRVPIVGANGAKFPGHLITTLGNAAASKAIRNAIFAGVPRGIWNRGYQAALLAAKGELKTLPERRKALFAKATEENISQAEIFAMLGVKGEADIDIDKLFDAAALLTAIRDGEATIAELIAIKQPPRDERGLAEAFGNQGATPVKAPPAPPAPKAATTKAPAATAAPKAAASDPKPPAAEDPPKGDPAGENVVDFPGDRRPVDESDPAGAETGPAQEGPSAEGGEPQVEQLEPEGEETGPAAPPPVDEDATIAEFNDFASAVQATSAWADFKGTLVAFRDGDAFRSAPEDLQRQAMVLAFNHATERGFAPPDGDVAWFRLWLWSLDRPSAAARPAFRKLMRGGQFLSLPEAERNATSDETTRAAGD